MTDKKLTKQQRLVLSKRAQGLVPLTAWVPSHALDDARYQCQWLCDAFANGQYYIPFMAKDIGSINRKSTGQFAKSI